MDRVEKRIRTKAWVHYAASCVEQYMLSRSLLPKNQKPLSPACSYEITFGKTDTSKVHLLQRVTGVLAQNWSRYRSGDRDVGLTTLKRVEQMIPGSLNVYKIGPDGAPLWTALWSNDERELWDASKSIAEILQAHLAFNSTDSYIYDYPHVESTKVYINVLAEYFEGLIRPENIGLTDIKRLSSLIAAFRLGQYRREAAIHQELLGHCIELLLTEKSSVVNSLRGYGIYDYLSQYVDRLIPHSEQEHKALPTTRRQAILSNHFNEIRDTFV
ncbi:hypothetical protein [Sedimenticola sp.]|uniref:hypothetical protein n=1 Tax=Sedimenticola sp. TaxID=1940285 RepID=UPI003D0E9135